MPSAALALLASLAFGSSDFLAGLVSRRASPVAVALWSQLTGAVALMVALAVSGRSPDASGILWGVAAGVTVAVGILSLYRALAIGPASVVAPVSASAVAIPVLVGILGGETPSPVVILGLVVTVGGVTLVSFAGGEDDAAVGARCQRRSPPRSSPGTPVDYGCRGSACWRPWRSWACSPSSGTSP